MKKIGIAAVFAVSMLTGCYTNVCPTYSVKPEAKDELKVENTTEKNQVSSEKES